MKRRNDPESNCPVALNCPDLPQLVTTKIAATVVGRSAATLKRWRYEGIGPNYVEIEGRVRYDIAVLREFVRKNTRVPSVRAAMEASRGAV